MGGWVGERADGRAGVLGRGVSGMTGVNRAHAARGPKGNVPGDTVKLVRRDAPPAAVTGVLSAVAVTSGAAASVDAVSVISGVTNVAGWRSGGIGEVSGSALTL